MFVTDRRDDRASLLADAPFSTAADVVDGSTIESFQETVVARLADEIACDEPEYVRWVVEAQAELVFGHPGHCAGQPLAGHQGEVEPLAQPPSMSEYVARPPNASGASTASWVR